MGVPGRNGAGEPDSLETDERGPRLLDHAVLRVAAWPVETLEGFTAPALAVAALRLLAMTASIEHRSASLIDALHAGVPAIADRELRGCLLAAKRSIHAGTGILRPPNAAIRARLDAVAPALATALARETEARAELATERARFEQLFASELGRQRHELRRVTETAAFRRALEIGNPVLAARWEPVRAAALSNRARVRRLEASIFHTLMRAVGRPTPQDAWAGVTVVAPVESEEDHRGVGRWSVEPAPPHRSFTVDLEPFAAIVAALRRLPRYRASRLRLNPTLRSVAGNWRYERAIGSGLEWDAAPDDAICGQLIAAFGDGRARTADAAVRELAGADDAMAARLHAAAARLLDLDVLEVDLTFPRAAESVWDALDAVVPALLPDDREPWVAVTGRVRRVCEYLGREWDDLDPSDVRALRQLVAVEIDALGQAFGQRGHPTGSILHLDTCVAFTVGWNRADRRKYEHAVGEVLAFHMADGAAERYRRVSLAAVAAAAAGDDSLLGLVDGTGVRRVAPAGDDIDTHAAIFARYTGASSDDVVEHCRAWERRLAPVQREPRVILTDLARRPVVAGPEGAFVLSSLAGPAPVVEWGRPQAGMFLARLASAVAGRDGAAPAVDELRRHVEALGDYGVVAADVVGSDPTDLNTAVRPEMSSTRLEPHGRGESSLRGLRLELDAVSLRPWVIDRNGNRKLATYQSAAAIGGTDPCSWLLFRIAMGHGWEFASFGFPALPAERSTWYHLPRLVLPGGTVLSAERWTIPGETLRAIASCDDTDRYLEWRALAERLGLPPVVRIRWDPHPAASPILLRTDSPLAVNSLFTRLPPAAPRLIVTELADGVEAHCVESPNGEHHLAELAVSWFDDSYFDRVLCDDAAGGSGAA